MRGASSVRVMSGESEAVADERLVAEGDGLLDVVFLRGDGRDELCEYLVNRLAGGPRNSVRHYELRSAMRACVPLEEEAEARRILPARQIFSSRPGALRIICF